MAFDHDDGVREWRAVRVLLHVYVPGEAHPVASAGRPTPPEYASGRAASTWGCWPGG